MTVDVFIVVATRQPNSFTSMISLCTRSCVQWSYSICDGMTEFGALPADNRVYLLQFYISMDYEKVQVSANLVLHRNESSEMLSNLLMVVGHCCFIVLKCKKTKWIVGFFHVFLPLKTVHVLRVFSVDGEDVRLMLWDTAGQEEFDAITKAYYRGAQACVLAFSTTDRDSFHAIHTWKRKVRRQTKAKRRKTWKSVDIHANFIDWLVYMCRVIPCT